MEKAGFPTEVIEKIRDSVDCNLYFFGTKVEVGTMYLILCGAVAVFAGLYILFNVVWKRKK